MKTAIPIDTSPSIQTTPARAPANDAMTPRVT